MSNPPVKLSDVAEHAGVSVMTVSRALNGKPDVSEQARRKVMEAVGALGYVANRSARGLKGGRTNVLGMVVQDLSSQYFTEIVRGASEAANRQGRDLLLYTASYDPEHEQRHIAALSSGLSDGLLVVLPSTSQRYVRSLDNIRVPVVIINYRGVATHLPAVRADNYRGARAATEHLIRLGHRRIGFITGKAQSGQSSERQRGYREALLNAGLAPDDALVRPGDWSQPRGFIAARELLDLPQVPSAIFAANDFTAFGAIEAVKDGGLRVPGDVSVIGFDDIPMAAGVHPPLTTVRHPLTDIGATAARLLLDLIEEREPVQRQIELPSELIVRQSTASAERSTYER